MRSPGMGVRSAWVVGIALLIALGALGSEPKYGFGGGGPGLGLLMADLDAITDFVEGAGFARFEGNMLLIGGGGRGGLLPGPVFGGAGWGAWIESDAGDRHAEYGLGLGGFDIGYAFAGNDRSALTLGGLLGAGGAEVILEDWTAPPSSVVPGGLIIEPDRTTYDCFFVFAAPYLEMQIQLLDWMAFGVRTGYVLPIFEIETSDAGPLDPPNLAPSGPYVRLSLVFGGGGVVEPSADGAELKPKSDVESQPLVVPEPSVQTESIVP